MWQPAVDDLADRYDLTVYRITRGGCPVNDVTVYHLDDVDGSKVPDHECSAWRASLYRRPSRRSTRTWCSSARARTCSASRTVAASCSRGTTATSRSGRTAWCEPSGWLASGSGVVVLSEILPTLPERVPACLAEHGPRPTPATGRRPWTSGSRPFNELIRSVPAMVPGVVTIDPTPLACPDGQCPAMRDGVVVHRDDNHLSRTFVAALGPALEALLRGVGVGFGPTP